ncbi:MAG TPA: endonuclease/exonuclease/phosphatase family protein [Gammaproteobacteria bacterium]|nr:endonuclease/exonuclease/phosphatase family protein [Gammaproteobacteria bacterium]
MTVADSAIRVLTWNVHSFVGRGGVRDPEAVAALIEEAAPDVCALQEIDARVALPGIEDPFSYFASRAGWTSVAARTIATASGHYGHVLMSRWPLELLCVEDLSEPRREPRHALIAEITAPFAKVAVMAAHLGVRPLERRRQLVRLKRALAALDGQPVIALGDFNDVRLRGVAERSLCPPLEPAPAPRTYPAAFPLFPLDRVWCAPPLEVLEVRTLSQARRLSDHLPLLARLRARGDALRS